MKNIFTFILIGLFISSTSDLAAQSKAIYTNPNFNRLARTHKILAIVPFDCEIQLRPKEMESISEKELIDLEMSEGLGVQTALQSYFLKRKGKDNIRVDFQDVDKTNTILKQNEIDQTNIGDYTHEQLAEMLGVDAIIDGKLSTKKPMSEGASAALGILVGVWGPTNSGNITIKIIDKTTGENLWQYDKQLSRSLGSDTNTIIAAMMRKASRKFPYSDLNKGR